MGGDSSCPASKLPHFCTDLAVKQTYTGPTRSGHGNYTLGVPEQIVFPEIVLDKVSKLNGMNITFVTSANTDEEGFALLKELGLPFKNVKKN